MAHTYKESPITTSITLIAIVAALALLAVVVITIAAGIDDIHPNGEASLQPTLDNNPWYFHVEKNEGKDYRKVIY
jgi:hypothetical protein